MPRSLAVTAVSPPFTGRSLPAPAFATAAFGKERALADIVLAGAAPLRRGAGGPRSALQTAQLALFSLGKLRDRDDVDGSFGPRTEQSVRDFQLAARLEPTGRLDAATLGALDRAAAQQIAALKQGLLPRGSKHERFKLVADIANLNNTHLYVLDKQSGALKALYLTSPGIGPTRRDPNPHYTQGDSFTIENVYVRAPWTPPSGAWAKGLKVEPPGIDNPTSVLKMELVPNDNNPRAREQYIHGIPARAERALGMGASHGCLRLSSSNVLDLHTKYAERQTQVTINRDARESARLAGLAAQAWTTDRPLDVGREYLFGFASGELGQNERSPRSPHLPTS